MSSSSVVVRQRAALEMDLLRLVAPLLATNTKTSSHPPTSIEGVVDALESKIQGIDRLIMAKPAHANPAIERARRAALLREREHAVDILMLVSSLLTSNKMIESMAALMRSTLNDALHTYALVSSIVLSEDNASSSARAFPRIMGDFVDRLRSNVDQLLKEPPAPPHTTATSGATATAATDRQR